MVMIQYCENSKNQEVELLKIGKKRCKKSKLCFFYLSLISLFARRRENGEGVQPGCV